MFQAMIYNNDVETTIHYPSANNEDPHLDSLQLKEDTVGVGTLIFKLYPNNQGYNLIKEFTTYVKVKDLRDNTIRFSGRIIKIEDKMDSVGQIYKDVTCESALGFLNDTKERGSSYYGANGSSFLTQMLNTHNNKVNDEHKKIYLGKCDINKNITHTCDFKTALAEILQTVEDYGGYISIRENNNKRYLDWVNQLETNVIEVDLGVNMKEIVRSNNIMDIGTRIIPLGANNLTIERVNGGKDYIDDLDAISKYGIIEKTVEYSDIENATELKNKCINDLRNYTQVEYTLSTSAIDLSYKTGVPQDRYKLGSPLHIRNRFMQIDDNYIVNSISLDLLTPYNPTLEISKRNSSLSQTISNIRSETITNNGVYNNVQIGSNYGIRAVRSDGKVVTTINATDGITIQNQNEKVFYVDDDGKLTAVKIQAKGGQFNNIKVKRGSFSEITVTDGITIEDGDLTCIIDSTGIKLVGPNNKKAKIEILDDGRYSGTYIRDDLYVEDVLRVFGDLKVEGSIYLGGTSIENFIEDCVRSHIKDNTGE